jgi:hypothetical protein
LGLKSVIVSFHSPIKWQTRIKITRRRGQKKTHENGDISERKKKGYKKERQAESKG